MKNALLCVLLAVLVWVGVEAALTIQATRAVEAALPVAITAQLQPLRASVTRKLEAIQIPETQPLVDAARAKIDAVQVQPVLDNAATLAHTATVKIEAVQLPQTQPLLDAAKDKIDAVDSNDLNALVQNATVAAHGVAVTSDVIAQAAPKMVAEAHKGEQQLTGIATDVHTVTTQIAKPKHFWGKVWEAMKSLGGLARFL